MRWTVTAVVVLLVAAGMGVAAPVPLCREGRSDYAIYLDAQAPGSVKQAAADLQTYLEQATGAKLPVVNAPQAAMIALGDTPALQAAGLSTKGMALESFRVVTRDRAVYVFGPDTADGQATPGGGTSAGTRNGVDGFLERFVGIRWLMPGPHGDYVPRASSLTIPDTDWQEAPAFVNRRLPYTQENRAEVKTWWARQKLGLSLSLYHSHNWHSIPDSAFKEHPEWFALRGGVRTPPVNEYSKLCPTNPGLIAAFAEGALKYFDANPQATCYSLSPSDGGGWCECPECTKRYERDPNGDLSVTPAIMYFYNEVAKRVAVKYPQKTLAGYVYADYVYPPREPFKLQRNLFLVWAPSFDYGFALFRPALQKRWDDLVPQWLKVTDNIAYYDLPNCVHNRMGAINPPALKILKFLYPRIKAAKMKGVYVYGNPAWGYAGPMNYLLAKLAWNPDADVDALFDEYCTKAYAEGAAEIKQLYALLDAQTEKLFLAHGEVSWTLTPVWLKEVYAANFPELERLYTGAEAKIEDPDAQYRLALLGTNLQVLNWYLRQYGFLPNAPGSRFYVTDDKFATLLQANQEALALAPDAARRKPAEVGQKWAVTPLTQVPNAAPATPWLLRGDQRLVLRPNGAGPVEVKFADVTGRGTLVKYTLYDPAGRQVAWGIVSPASPLKLEAPLAEYYHLTIEAGSASFALQVSGANWCVFGRLTGEGLHFLGKTTPLYFTVPAGVSSFAFWLAATPPGETGAGVLYAPEGRVVARFDCATKAVDNQKISVGPNDVGVWKFVIGPAATGIVDDVWVKPGEELSGYFSFAPEQALDVAPAR